MDRCDFYQEVLVDIALNVGYMLHKHPEDECDSRLLVGRIRECAERFLAENAGTDWEETDYVEAVDAYASKNFNWMMNIKEE